MTRTTEGEGRPTECGWRLDPLPSDLIERLAAVAVRVAHEAADMLVLAAPLPIPEWSVGMYVNELQHEMDVVLFEWLNISEAQPQHVRQIAGTAFKRRPAQLTSNEKPGGSA